MSGRDDLARQAYEAVQAHGGLTAASRETGIPRATLWTRSKEYESREEPEQTSWNETRSRDEWVIECRDNRIRNVDDAIKKSGVDMALWYIHEVKVNGWDVTMKIRGQGGEPDRPFRGQNQQIKVVLRRRVPATVADAMKPLESRLRKAAPKSWPKKKYTPPKDPHLYEIGLVDIHFGKMAWGAETGTDYDLKIAETLYEHAAEDLLRKASGYNIERFELPIGQDFFHFCNEEGTAAKSGNVLDTDGRLPKVFEVGYVAIEALVRRLLEVAPVTMRWVPGNHDLTASFALAFALDKRFGACEHVEVDLRPRTRKAIRYGCNLLAWHHGDDEKPRDMPVIVMSENRDLMDGVEHIEIHGGHFHKSKAIEWLSVETFPGNIIYRTLPSLSGRDAWHYRKGYGSRQAAEAYLWSKRDGYAGHFATSAKVLEHAA